MTDEIPEGLERFVNIYGENVKEFTDKYESYFTPVPIKKYKTELGGNENG